MTRETRYHIAPNDIIALSVECRQCHSRLTMPADTAGPTPYDCPKCGATWHTKGSDQPDHVARLASLLKQVTAHNIHPSGGYVVRLELDGMLP